jgi:hypothetical protein
MEHNKQHEQLDDGLVKPEWNSYWGCSTNDQHSATTWRVCLSLQSRSRSPRKPKSQRVERGSVIKMNEWVKNPLNPPSIYKQMSQAQRHGRVVMARSHWRKWDPFGRWPRLPEWWGRPTLPRVCCKHILSYIIISQVNMRKGHKC